MGDITLKRTAGEKRERAHQMFKDLEDHILRQARDELKEGETQLTGDEIAKRRQAADDLLQEAQAIQGVDDLKGIFEQPPENLSPEARKLQLREQLVGFMPSTNVSNTTAVPYWILIGMPGTCVEMTKR